MSIRLFENKKPSLGERVFIDESAQVIGDVHLGDDCSIWPGAVVRGDVNSIRIGQGSNVQDNSVLHVTHRHSTMPKGAPLIIGEYVTVGHQVVLHGCTIGELCLIGMGSIILDEAIIESNVLLAAGSLVPQGKTLESGYLYLGNPAKKIRSLSDEELAWFKYSARHYMTTKEKY